MKKIIVLYIIFSLFSCSKNQGKNSNSTKNKPENKPENKIVSKDLVNHFFQANGGSILYLKNGDVKGCAKCDFDDEFISELLKTETYSTYKDYENFIINKDNDTLNFFDNNGKILSDWRILKGVPIENEMSVISFSSKGMSKNSEVIDKTAVLIFQPESKTFKDENSEEAEVYYTAMDDWGWYSYEIDEYFKGLNVMTIYLKKRFVSMKIENNQIITIDTKKPINNANVTALLYKKNKRPIILSLIPNDNDKELIKKYLHE